MGSKYNESNFHGGVIQRTELLLNVKTIEHGMKVVENVLEQKHCRIVTVNESQFGFLPKRGATDAVFIYYIDILYGKDHE